MGSKYKEGRKPAKAAAQSTAGKRTFEFPSNVKQIGGIYTGLKIYIEDYAYSYIQKLGAKKESAESAAFLVGYLAEALGEEILVIMGAFEAPVQHPPKDGHVFSDDDIEYANKTIKRYFEGMEIVGWARIQPGYGLYLSAADIGNHYLNFTDKHAVLFLCDTEEKLDCFFSWNNNQDDLDEVTGYFVFYDKNHGMNDFLIETKRSLNKKEILEATEIEGAGIETADSESVEPDLGEKKSVSIEKAKRIADISRQKRIISMMTSVSMLLFFACLIMGIGLLQSGERISIVEKQMRELRSGYNNIVSRLNDSAFPAFAAQPVYESTENPEGDGVTSEINKTMADLMDEELMDEKLIAEELIDEGKVSAEISLDDALGITVDGDLANTEDPASQAPQQDVSPDVSPDVPSVSADNIPPDGFEEITAQKEPESAVQVREYIVKSGDTLSYISEQFYGTTRNVDELMRVNNISEPSKLRAGKKIIVP